MSPDAADDTPLGRPLTSAESNIQQLQEVAEKLSVRCRRLERRQDRQSVVIDELRAHMAMLEEHFAKSQSDFAYAQQQLEYVAVGLEREHGIVADHTEQLRLFANESSRHGVANDGNGDQRPLLFTLANWLYAPLVHFAKGVYTLFSPLIDTAQSLSLFNAEVLLQFSDQRARLRWQDARNGDLLQKLQRGVLDPNSGNARKMRAAATESEKKGE